MQFDYYVNQGIVKRVTKNAERAKSLVLESERKLKSLKEKLQKIGVRDDNANDYVEYCYDTIMLLARAKLYVDGYSSSGQGAHEAELAYLQVLGFSEQDIRFADQMRYFRNGILYYGTALDREYAEKVVGFTNRVFPRLKRVVTL